MKVLWLNKKRFNFNFPGVGWLLKFSILFGQKTKFSFHGNAYIINTPRAIFAALDYTNHHTTNSFPH
jgi:hypothetical protein